MGMKSWFGFFRVLSDGHAMFEQHMGFSVYDVLSEVIENSFP